MKAPQTGLPKKAGAFFRSHAAFASHKMTCPPERLPVVSETVICQGFVDLTGYAIPSARY